MSISDLEKVLIKIDKLSQIVELTEKTCLKKEALITC